MNTKYIWLLIILLGYTACNDIEDVLADNNIKTTIEELPALTAGSADFSNYISLGASFTAGYTDNGLFIAAQENSFPNILSQQFANANGGSFSQPLMKDNIGGFVLGTTVVVSPRLYFDGSGPAVLPATPTTEVTTNLGSIFNNVGVPGAKSTHIDFNGYASLNPYFGRMATSASVSMLEYAIAQNPTFFTLSEIGGNDVLGYARTGGDGSEPITPTATFDFVFNDMVTQLLATGAKGVVTNVPYITDLPHFTTITFDYLDPNDDDIGPLLIPQIPALNAQLYGPLDNIFTAYGEPDRFNLLSTTSANPILIYDEDAVDRSAEITEILTPILGAPTATAFGAIFGKSRQTNANDLIVLSTSSVLATTVAGPPAPVNVNGISYPLADKWVLTPKEQLEIKTATDAYNATIASVASSKGLALVDLNAILTEAASTGIAFDDYTMTTSLVVGGLVSLDGIHLTARGYALMANKFLEKIDETYGSNFVASGNVVKAGDYPTNYSPDLQ